MHDTLTQAPGDTLALLGGRRLQGVVFDMDGTIVDNMPLHAEAFDLYVAAHGLPPLTMADRARFDGQRNRDIFPVLLGRELSAQELQACIDEKEGTYRELSRGRLRPHTGLPELLEHLAARGVPVAVATAAPPENVPHTLAETGLGDRLRVVVRADEVKNGKPAPDVFLEAARRIGADPRACLAFEDAPLGIRAARAAGMGCVAITTSFSAAAMAEHGAAPDLAVKDYAEFLALRLL